MTVRLLRVPHFHDEIVMGHKLFFPAVPGCDTISATANKNGFTVLNAIARRLGWNSDLLCASVDRANSETAVICVQEFSPRLILVPKLRSDSRIDASRFMQEFFQICKRIDSRAIQFTHFGFLSKCPDLGVMEEVFQALSKPPEELQEVDIFFDVDFRRDYYRLFCHLAHRLQPKNFVFLQ